MLVYLGGAIDLVDGDIRQGWRDKMKHELKEIGVSTFDPASAFSVNLHHKEVAESLVKINEVALLSCDHAFFVMGDKYPSVGTPIELYIAKMNNIPHTVIWNPVAGSFDANLGIPVRKDPYPAYVNVFADKIVCSFHNAIRDLVHADGNDTDKPMEPQLPGVSLGDMINDTAKRNSLGRH